MEKKESRGRPRKVVGEMKKETRGRPKTGRTLKSISFGIDSELYDQYNEKVKKQTSGLKKTGLGISLNTFIKNNLDKWLSQEITDFSKDMVYYIPSEEMKEKMTVFYQNTPARQNAFIKEIVENAIELKYSNYKDDKKTAIYYYILSLYLDLEKNDILFFDVLKTLELENISKNIMIDNLEEELKDIREEARETEEKINNFISKKENLFSEVDELTQEIIMTISQECEWDSDEKYFLDIIKEWKKKEIFTLENLDEIMRQKAKESIDETEKSLENVIAKHIDNSPFIDEIYAYTRRIKPENKKIKK